MQFRKAKKNRHSRGNGNPGFDKEPPSAATNQESGVPLPQRRLLFFGAKKSNQKKHSRAIAVIANIYEGGAALVSNFPGVFPVVPVTQAEDVLMPQQLNGHSGTPVIPAKAGIQS